MLGGTNSAATLCTLQLAMPSACLPILQAGDQIVRPAISSSGAGAFHDAIMDL